jgi:hypothetical protein
MFSWESDKRSEAIAYSEQSAPDEQPESSEAQAYRSKALEFVQLAKEAKVPRVREHLLRMGRSCLLIAKNAEWLESTDTFLREWRGR